MKTVSSAPRPSTRRTAARPMSYGQWSAGLAPIVAIVALLAFALPLHAQTDPGIWFPLDPMPPGTPADVVLDVAASSASESFFDVFIHGFWRKDRVGPDGLLYQQID